MATLFITFQTSNPPAVDLFHSVLLLRAPLLERLPAGGVLLHAALGGLRHFRDLLRLGRQRLHLAAIAQSGSVVVDFTVL